MTTTLPPSTFVTVDGAGYREKRKDAGLEISDVVGVLADAGIRVSRQRISALELGTKPRVRPKLWAALCDAISVPAAERRELVADKAA